MRFKGLEGVFKQKNSFERFLNKELLLYSNMKGKFQARQDDQANDGDTEKVIEHYKSPKSLEDKKDIIDSDFSSLLGDALDETFK